MSESKKADGHGLTPSFIDHIVRTPSQYDSTCRALAAEVARLREVIAAKHAVDRSSVGVGALVEEREALCEKAAKVRAELRGWWWPATPVLDDLLTALGAKGE